MVKIEVKNGVANVYTPYSAKFVKKIKGIGGSKWDSVEKCWIVSLEAVNVVRQIMEDVYGYSDISTNETVNLEISVLQDIAVLRGDVNIYGKVLAHAFGRDSGAKIGDDVAFISGGAESGGSANRWLSKVCAGSKIMLSNVNENLFNKGEDLEAFQIYHPTQGWIFPESWKEAITVRVIEDSKPDRKALMEERERLLARLNEINDLLDLPKGDE